MTGKSESPNANAEPQNNPFYVISGCSGSGKSTLVEALAERGETVVAEPGRRVVKEQMRSDGDGLPWTNLQRFAELCADMALRDFDDHVPLGRRTFFDRSLIDVAAAMERHDLVALNALSAALQSKRYAPVVFMSPPWKALFRQDSERRHTFSDALVEYEALVPFYRRWGYEIVILPQASVAERIAVLLSRLPT